MPLAYTHPMSDHGAADLPDYAHRLRLDLIVETEARDSELHALLREAFERLAVAIGGRLELSDGSVGVLPMDGLTHYYDVHGSDCLAWTYWGRDYGHPLEAELRADDSERLERLLAELSTQLKPAFRWKRIDGEMPGRADY